MEWLAEFLNWEVRLELSYYGSAYYSKESGNLMCGVLNFEDMANSWAFWMEEVEPRIREKGLTERYVSALYAIVEADLYEADPFERMELDTAVLFATLPQRAEALRRVLQQ